MLSVGGLSWNIAATYIVVMIRPRAHLTVFYSSEAMKHFVVKYFQVAWVKAIIKVQRIIA